MRRSVALAALLTLCLLLSALSFRGSKSDGSATSTTTSPSTTESATTSTIDFTATRVLVVGDSLAFLLGEALDRLPPGQRPVISNGGVLGCGILPGLRVSYGRTEPTPTGCDAWPQRWAQALADFDPDVVVVLNGFWDAYDWVLDAVPTAFGTPAWDAFASEQFGAAIDLLGSHGARVVWLQAPYFQPDESDQRAATYYEAHGEYRSAFDDARVRHLNDLYEAVADGRRCAVVADARECLCPGDDFVKVLDRVVVRNDGVHFTGAGADLLAGWLVPYLEGAAAASCPLAAG